MEAHYLNCSIQSRKILACMKMQHTQFQEDLPFSIWRQIVHVINLSTNEKALACEM